MTKHPERHLIVNALRWLAVLPGAIVCVFIVAFPIHWVVMLIQLYGTYRDDHILDAKTWLAAIPPETLERFGYAFFTPLTMVVAGVAIAPKLKFFTGIAMATLWGVGFVVSIVMVLSGDTMTWLRLFITIALGIAGVAIGLSVAHQEASKVKSKNSVSDDTT